MAAVRSVGILAAVLFITFAPPAAAENVLRFTGIAGGAVTMDPHSYGPGHNRVATKQVYEALLDIDSNLAIVPQLAQPGTNLRAWLFVILRNCHINEIRHEQRIEPLDDTTAAEPLLATSSDPETSLALSEVRSAFLNLSQEHREVLLLVGIEGLQYQEAAAILEVPLGTVRSRLSRARDALRQRLKSGTGALARPLADRAAALSP
jgi:RNA polymerase sigma factor (sigma-70 family)